MTHPMIKAPEGLKEQYANLDFSGCAEQAIDSCIALIRKHQAEQQGDGIYKTDNDGNISFHPPLWSQLNGLRPAEPVDLEVCIRAYKDADDFLDVKIKAVLAAANVKVKE